MCNRGFTLTLKTRLVIIPYSIINMEYLKSSLLRLLGGGAGKGKQWGGNIKVDKRSSEKKPILF